MTSTNINVAKIDLIKADVKIRKATCGETNEIVEIHKRAFPNFFLTLLGSRFLTRLYLGFIGINHGIIFVAEIRGQIVGFLAGTTEPEIFFSALRKSQWLGFCLSASPALVANPIIVTKRLFYGLFFKGDRPKSLVDSALISSIAISPKSEAIGIGTALINAFENHARERCLTSIYLTTDSNNNDKVLNFYKKNGFYIESSFFQTNDRQMYRLIKTDI